MPDPKAIKGLLLDMDGVFYIGDELIDGAIQTLETLKARNIPFRFITNTTTKTPGELIAKLTRLGLPCDENQLFTAVSATESFLDSQGSPSCHFLVRKTIRPTFQRFRQDPENPDFVVIGDIGAEWHYQTLNSVFNMLMQGSKLVCMHKNKYWQTEGGLLMDIGAFVAALEYTSGQEAIVMGKPSPEFFKGAIASMGLEPSEVAIIGDDIESDINGGQQNGVMGIMVETGKYRPEIAAKSGIVPDFQIPSIKELPDLLA